MALERLQPANAIVFDTANSQLFHRILRADFFRQSKNIFGSSGSTHNRSLLSGNTLFQKAHRQCNEAPLYKRILHYLSGRFTHLSVAKRCEPALRHVRNSLCLH